LETKRTPDRPSGEEAFLLKLNRQLKLLEPRHIVQIDEALDRVGPSGQVRLIVNRGRLRFIQEVEIEDLQGGC